MSRSHNSLSLLLASGAALSAAVLLTGCGAIANEFANTYAITYEVTLSGPDTSELAEYSFEGKESRVADAEIVQSGGKGVPSLKTTKGVWTHETMIQSTKKASISATPLPGTIAHCRILIDGKKEIASVEGKPGEAVTCEAVTPDFPKKS
ncbi:hypothetical protein [Lysinibacter sp. HNR]|uniref:hypothetical protein n=1 Tax=Lysinibacter sp. HNR TaxID=3031408 RepID=UPI0024352038|nr:hypothetical protein [Lysinibacter sp. HNR]WGD37415.1 hypothetical protein FrondiHNR_00385 [Lysinibacter sp. HNR]